jgi:hypothetical protein
MKKCFYVARFCNAMMVHWRRTLVQYYFYSAIKVQRGN